MRYQIFPVDPESYSSSSLDDALEHYEKYFEDRDMNNFYYYSDINLPKVTKRILSAVPFDIHTWRMGDKFYKISNDKYGTVSYYWVIPWFNSVPTESHISTGEQIMVPRDLNILFSFF